jgi:hypothetical protein
MMDVEYKNGEVLLNCEDWSTLTDEEHAFLSDSYWADVLWVGTTAGDAIKMHLSNSAKENLRRITKVKNLAKEHGVRFRASADAFIIKLEEAKKEEDRKERIDRIKRYYTQSLDKAIELAHQRMTSGCGMCPYLRSKGQDSFCTAANRYCRKRDDEAEFEFYARREAQFTNQEVWYFATAYPCPGCLYVINGRKALEQRTELLKK